MKKSKYKGKFSALALKALFLESAGRQYVAELEPYGVTMEFLDEFAARIEVFTHLPSDEDERENANDYVIEKKQIRSELTVELRMQTYGVVFSATLLGYSDFSTFFTILYKKRAFAPVFDVFSEML